MDSIGMSNILKTLSLLACSNAGSNINGTKKNMHITYDDTMGQKMPFKKHTMKSANQGISQVPSLLFLKNISSFTPLKSKSLFQPEKCKKNGDHNFSTKKWLENKNKYIYIYIDIRWNQFVRY